VDGSIDLGRGGTSIAFLSDRRVVLSGPSDFRVVEVDFTSPTSPSVSTFFPQTGNPPVIDVDSVKGLIVAGDSGGRLVKTFNAVTSGQVSSIPTSQASVNSLSVSAAGFALASGTYSFTIDKVDLVGLKSSSFSPGLNGGLVTAVDDLTGACGEITGTRVALLDLNGISRVVSVVDSGIASISTLAIGTLPPPPVSNPPKMVLTPTFVNFPMTLLSSNASLKIQNTGGTTLNVRDIHTSDRHFRSRRLRSMCRRVAHKTSA
jgi:WD40 repeat protein